MPYEEDDLYATDESYYDSRYSIDPRDTYGDRFEVKSRNVTSKPRSAISSGISRIKNSDRIFSRKHDRSDLGGSVNIKNINASKETKLVSNDEDQKPKVESVPKREENTFGEKQFRSAGLDSLFSSTAQPNDADKTAKISDEGLAKNKQNENQPKAQKKSYTFELEEEETLNRKLTVLKPISYNSAKDISAALKGGNVLVLCLKNTNYEAAARLLDFAFGAASISGARVSVEAEKTYVFTSGPGLTQREKLLCIKQGVAIKK